MWFASSRAKGRAACPHKLPAAGPVYSDPGAAAKRSALRTKLCRALRGATSRYLPIASDLPSNSQDTPCICGMAVNRYAKGTAAAPANHLVPIGASGNSFQVLYQHLLSVPGALCGQYRAVQAARPSRFQQRASMVLAGAWASALTDYGRAGPPPWLATKFEPAASLPVRCSSIMAECSAVASGGRTAWRQQRRRSFDCIDAASRGVDVAGQPFGCNQHRSRLPSRTREASSRLTWAEGVERVVERASPLGSDVKMRSPWQFEQRK